VNTALFFQDPRRDRPWRLSSTTTTNYSVCRSSTTLTGHMASGLPAGFPAGVSVAFGSEGKWQAKPDARAWTSDPAVFGIWHPANWYFFSIYHPMYNQLKISSQVNTVEDNFGGILSFKYLPSQHKNVFYTFKLSINSFLRTFYRRVELYVLRVLYECWM
jgi:hypothetical protein